MYLLYENEKKNQGKHSPFLKDIHNYNQKRKTIVESVRYNIMFVPTHAREQTLVWFKIPHLI